MNREKQIEEMAKATTKHCEIYNQCGSCHWSTCNECLAEALYNAGYRKQSEPFSCSHENGGEWVQLPCKVGDILYVISQMKDRRILPFINEFEVTSISIKKKSIVIYHEMNGYIKTFKQTDFGKTVFLTKKEAEAKIKGSK